MGALGSFPLWAFLEHALLGPQQKLEAAINHSDSGKPAWLVKSRQTVLGYKNSDSIFPIGLGKQKDLIIEPLPNAKQRKNIPQLDGSELYLINKDGHFLMKDGDGAIKSLKPIRTKNGSIQRNKDGALRFEQAKICNESEKAAAGYEAVKLRWADEWKSIISPKGMIVNPRLLLLAAFAFVFDSGWYELGKYVGKTDEKNKLTTVDPTTEGNGSPHTSDAVSLAALALPISLQTPNAIKHKIKKQLADAATQSTSTSSSSTTSSSVPLPA